MLKSMLQDKDDLRPKVLKCLFYDCNSIVESLSKGDQKLVRLYSILHRIPLSSLCDEICKKGFLPRVCGLTSPFNSSVYFACTGIRFAADFTLIVTTWRVEVCYASFIRILRVIEWRFSLYRCLSMRFQGVLLWKRTLFSYFNQLVMSAEAGASGSGNNVVGVATSSGVVANAPRPASASPGPANALAVASPPPAIPTTSSTAAVKIRGAPSKYVKLNVGGALFYTTIDTLTKQDNMLRAMFSGRMEVLTDSEGNIYFFNNRFHSQLIWIYKYNQQSTSTSKFKQE